MGVDICYFLDHDLPTDNAKDFLKEFKKRVKGKKVILHDCEKQYWCNVEQENNVWYIKYLETFEGTFCSHVFNLSVSYKNKNYEIELSIYRKCIEIDEMKYKGQPIPAYCRWNRMYTFLQDDKTFDEYTLYIARNWINNMLERYKEFLNPIFHSSKVLLTEDSSSFRHETLAGDFIMEKGLSIDEALDKNNEFASPCTVLKNENCFGFALETDEPFFMFNF